MANVVRTHVGLETLLVLPEPEHRAFALASMTRQLRTVPGLRDLDQRGFRRIVAALESRWDDAAVDVLVALDPADTWLVMGFVIGRPADETGPAVLTYLHVRGGYRGLGLGTLLAAQLGIGHGVPALIEFPTWDLVRDRAGRTNESGEPSTPVGLLHNRNWDLTLVEPRLPEGPIR